MKDALYNNMNETGGGLATAVTGRVESNRHALARIEKVTFGQVVKHLALKKNGGYKITAKELLKVYTHCNGTPEWHHAGKLPKSFGGGMKKTYFLNDYPNVEEVKNWVEKYKNSIEVTQSLRPNFLEKHGTPFIRTREIPPFSIITNEEMQGKFGWFEVLPHHNYKLQRYYSGYTLSEKDYTKYQNL